MVFLRARVLSFCICSVSEFQPHLLLSYSLPVLKSSCLSEERNAYVGICSPLLRLPSPPLKPQPFAVLAIEILPKLLEVLPTGHDISE